MTERPGRASIGCPVSALLVVILAVPTIVQDGAIQAQQHEQASGAAHGSRELRFTERDTQSSIREQAKRFNWQMSWVKQQDSDAGEYDLSREFFRVYVPTDLGDNAAGLLVWISPNESGEIPAQWRPVLQR